MQPESLNEFANKSAEECIYKLQNKYDPERAKPATLLFKLYLLTAFVMVVYAILFAVYGYDKLPSGVEIAELCGQLPTEFLPVDDALLQQHRAKSFARMTERQAFNNKADRWAVNVRHGYALYDFTLLTNASEYPLLKVFDEKGNELANNRKPANYQPFRPDEKEKTGFISSVYTGLHPNRTYLVEVVRPARGGENRHYVLDIKLRGHDHQKYGLLILVGKIILLTLPMAYLSMIILAVYLARKKPPVPGYKPNESAG